MKMMIFCLFVFLVSNPLFAFEAVPGEFLVRLRAGVEVSTVDFGSGSWRRIPFSDVILVDRPTVETEETSLDFLRRNPFVESVEPNYRFHLHALPNDPQLEKLWGLQNTGQRDGSWQEGVSGVDIQAPAAWELTRGSHDVVVAVIDTGIDLMHPDLRGNLWMNPLEEGGAPGVDDDGNGLIDDVHGYDFINNDGDPSDDHNHGTHVAGTIAARGDNGVGVTGVAWTARLMAVKAFDARGEGTTASAVSAIGYAVQMGARVLNNSWGGEPPSDILRSAIESAAKAEVLFVASAGNSRANSDVAPQYPAGFLLPNVVSVAAINNKGLLASFSNFGRKSVHVAAPGVSIYSTVRGGYGSMSGTSMAAPHVSGIAALMLAREPGLGVVEMKARLLDSVVFLEGMRGKTISQGIVSAAHAVAGTKAPFPPDHPANWPQVRALSVSTEHPYKGDQLLEWTIHEPGARSIALYFENFELEDPYDNVTIYNADDQRVDFLTGAEGLGWTRPIRGDRVRIVFDSNARNNFYGFDLVKAAFRY